MTDAYLNCSIGEFKHAHRDRLGIVITYNIRECGNIIFPVGRKKVKKS